MTALLSGLGAGKSPQSRKSHSNAPVNSVFAGQEQFILAVFAMKQGVAQLGGSPKTFKQPVFQQPVRESGIAQQQQGVKR